MSRFKLASLELLVTGIFVIGALTGCATARPSHREGLIQKWDRMDSGDSSAFHAQGNSETKTENSQVALTAYRSGGAKIPLQWPLQKVEVTSPFGSRWGTFHEGVDLRAKTGTPIYASGNGVVIYSGTGIRGYGKLIVIRHSRKIATVYAHNSRILVARGQKVNRGQRIAYSGQSGNAKGPHLHFEIRKDAVAINPSRVLPHSTELAERPVKRNIGRRRRLASMN